MGSIVALPDVGDPLGFENRPYSPSVTSRSPRRSHQFAIRSVRPTADPRKAPLPLPTTVVAILAVTILSLPAPAKAWVQVGGVIEGTLVLDLGAAKKTAPRYAGASPMIRTMQPVPAVVYLTGSGLDARLIVATVDMDQQGGLFVPAALGVQTGTVVRFPNADPFFHNVYSYAGNGRFDLGRFPEGESREVTFDEPGIVRVFCEIHEFMRAVILVTENPFHGVVAADGTFRIGGVPPGEYILTAFHPDLGSLEEQVAVTDRQTVRLRLVLGG